MDANRLDALIKWSNQSVRCPSSCTLSEAVPGSSRERFRRWFSEMGGLKADIA
jgi:hypothetical protein